MRSQDLTRSSTDILKGPQHHEPVQARYRPMRGQAYVQLEERVSSLIEMPKADQRYEKWHQGRVLALGEPARMGDNGPTVPWGCSVGDTVVFVMAVWLDRMRVLEFLGVDGQVAVIAQGEIMGVVE